MASTFRLRPRYRLGRTWRVDADIKSNFLTSRKGEFSLSRTVEKINQNKAEAVRPPPYVSDDSNADQFASLCLSSDATIFAKSLTDWEPDFSAMASTLSA